MRALGLLALTTTLSAGALRAQQDSAREAGMLEPIGIRATASRPGLSVTLLDSTRLRTARLGLSFDEVLAGVPGLSAQGRGTFALDTRLVIRGAGARSPFGVRGITVLLDGVPQSLADGQANLGTIDPAALERTAVVRGAAAAWYGNAAGGVVRFETTAPLGAPLLRTRAAGGSDGMLALSATARSPLARGGVVLSASSVRQDGWRDHTAGRLHQAAVAAGWPVGGATLLRLRVRVADLARADNPGALDSAQLAANPRQAQARNVAFAAGKAAREWQVAGDVRRATPRADLSAVVWGTTRELDNPLPTSWVDLSRRTAGARVAAQWPVHPRAAVMAGADVQVQDDERRNFDNDSGVIGTVARLDQREQVTATGARAAVLVTTRPGVITAAVRADRVAFRVTDHLLGDGDGSGRRTMDAVSWSLTVSRTMGPVRIHAGGGTSFETPTTTELARPGTGGFNTALEAQRGRHGELGVAWESARASAALTAWRTELSDGLVPREEPAAPGRFFFTNASRVRLQGLEFAAFARLAPWLRARAAAALSRNRYVLFPTDSTPLDAHTVPGTPERSLAFALTASPGRWFAELEAAHTGRVFGDDQNTAAAPAATLLHLRSALRRGWFAPFAGVRNLTNARAVGSLNVNGALRRFFEPVAGRTWYVGVALDGGGGGAGP